MSQSAVFEVDLFECGASNESLVSDQALYLRSIGDPTKRNSLLIAGDEVDDLDCA